MADKMMKFTQIQNPPRSLRRSIAKANGLPLRTGPAKASDGSAKGPARTPSRYERIQMLRAARKG
jgi:hypothetical protein